MDVDLAADWSDSAEPDRSPSRSLPRRRNRQGPQQAALAPRLEPADEERVTALLAEMTRETSQISRCFPNIPPPHRNLTSDCGEGAVFGFHPG